MTPLEKTPHDLREFLDDADAKTVLVQVGLLDKLLELAGRADLPTPRADAVYYSDHPTHWVSGVHYHGYPLPADNGYAVRCFPKSRYSLNQFRQMIRGGAAAVPIGFAGGGWLQPPPN